MLIWVYSFEDGIVLEMINPLNGIQLLKMVEKHGYATVDFKHIRVSLRKDDEWRFASSD